MNLFVQTLLVFALMLIILGYVQFRRSGDIIAVFQELARPSYLVPAGLVAVAYLVLKIVFSLLGKVLS